MMDAVVVFIQGQKCENMCLVSCGAVLKKQDVSSFTPPGSHVRKTRLHICRKCQLVYIGRSTLWQL